MAKTMMLTFLTFVMVMLSMGSLVQAAEVKLELVAVPAGNFLMGSDGSGEGDDKPAHEVHINAFKMMKFEVTQALFRSVMGKNPSYFKGDDLPVERVSWIDVQTFIKQLNFKTGRSFRLPTEAEWEYAARAGHRTRYGWHGGADKAYLYAWFGEGSNEKTHPVGQKRANDFGLYDMHGNVWEWVEDCWNGSYVDAPGDGRAWKSGECSKRVLRGGSWDNDVNYLRSAYRTWFSRSSRYDTLGFRLVQE